MKRLLFVLAALLAAFALPARADHLDGIVPLAKDDLAAVSQLKAMPDRHAMLYFGDHDN
mgnify:FL=1|jgi:hypothetical protein